jgi:nucleoid DNA-binding protein
LFDAIIKALTYRQSVQLPFGKLEVRKTPRPTRQLAFGTIVERFKSKYRIVFIPEDIEGISDDEHY